MAIWSISCGGDSKGLKYKPIFFYSMQESTASSSSSSSSSSSHIYFKRYLFALRLRENVTNRRIRMPFKPARRILEELNIDNISETDMVELP
jgi:hypothetical protein